MTLSSASKAFNLAGMRWAGLHAGSDAVHAALESLPHHYLGAPNVMGVVATVAAWTEGDAWLRAVLEVLDENRRLLGELLDRHLPGSRYRPPDATYLAWIDLSALEWGDNPARRILKDAKVALHFGPAFGAEGAGHVRLNFGTSPEILTEAIDRIAALSDR